jgi:hypothetical protein
MRPASRVVTAFMLLFLAGTAHADDSMSGYNTDVQEERTLPPSETPRAEEIKWEYNWDRAPVAVLSDSGNGGVAYTSELQKDASAAPDLVLTNLSVFNSAPVVNYGANITDGVFRLTLSLKDKEPEFKGDCGWRFKLKVSGPFSSFSALFASDFKPTFNLAERSPSVLSLIPTSALRVVRREFSLTNGLTPLLSRLCKPARVQEHPPQHRR